MALGAHWCKCADESKLMKLFQSAILLNVALLTLSLCFHLSPSRYVITVGCLWCGRGNVTVMCSALLLRSLGNSGLLREPRDGFGCFTEGHWSSMGCRGICGVLCYLIFILCLQFINKLELKYLSVIETNFPFALLLIFS